MSSKRLELLESLQLGCETTAGDGSPRWLEEEVSCTSHSYLGSLWLRNQSLLKVQQELDSFLLGGTGGGDTAQLFCSPGFVLSRVLGERSALLCYHLFSLVLT